MSRKDTIILAVLVNAALLTFLFMLAVNIDETSFEADLSTPVARVEHQKTEQKISKKQPEKEPLVRKAGGDELDIVLKEFTEKTKETPVVTKVETEKPVVQITEKTKANYLEVTVKHGDFLGKIARDNGTTVSTIMKLNHLSSERIDVGQVLKVPKMSKATTTQQRTKKVSDPHYYIVQKGDNPWKIAKKFHVRFNELLSLNNLDEQRARALKPGDKIRVN